MTQGTISVLVGCHSPVHSLLVLLAWRKLYKRWPRWWQVICIFLHDIGHIGKQYLDNWDEKKEHWKLGAKIAGCFFGDKGYDFTAGHCSSSPVLSDLRRADKYSWLIAPYWWLWSNTVFEPKLMRRNKTRKAAVETWIRDVQAWWDKQDIEHSLHEYYINGCGDGGQP